MRRRASLTIIAAALVAVAAKTPRLEADSIARCLLAGSDCTNGSRDNHQIHLHRGDQECGRSE